MNQANVLLSGAVPEPSFIMVKDEYAELIVRGNLHEEWGRKPPVFIVEDWPENWHVNAVVVTPLNILGTEGITSFAIIGDEELTEEERKVLNAYIRVCMTSAGSHVNYRDMTNATGLNRRTITKTLRDLVEKGVGTMRTGRGFSLDIGRWRPDAAKAKAFGLKIEEK
jgi:hypothetical protein